MVWMHGGGMQEGYAHEMEFDVRFARGVILVSVGYRSTSGFLTHPGCCEVGGTVKFAL